MLAFYRLIEARAHARAGDAPAAGRALAASDTLLNQAANHHGNDPAWIDFYTHARLAADAVEIHRDLGLSTPALRWNAEAAMPTDTFAAPTASGSSCSPAPASSDNTPTWTPLLPKATKPSMS